ncbi:MAG: hypothetical protein V1660_02100 [archaeon]
MEEENKKPSGGKKLAPAAVIIGLVLVVGITLIYFLSQSPKSDLNADNSGLEITYLTTDSAMPTEVLTMAITIPDSLYDGDVKVRFSDDKGYDVEVPLFYYNQDAAVVFVPVYFDKEGNFSSGEVDIELVVDSEDKEYTSNKMKIGIKELPNVQEKPGTVTLEYINRMIETDNSLIGKLSQVNDNISTLQLQQSLTDQRNELVNLKNNVNDAMNSKGNFVFGNFNGTVLKLDKQTLELSDRLIAAWLLQNFQTQEQDSGITGNAVLSDDANLDILKESFDNLFRDIGQGLRENKETMTNLGETLVGLGGAISLVPGGQVAGPAVAGLGAIVWFAGLHVNTAFIMAADASISNALDENQELIKEDVKEYIEAVFSKGITYWAGETGTFSGYMLDSLSTMKSAFSLLDNFNENVEEVYGNGNFLVMVGTAGDGEGKIISYPPGISCPGKCTQEFAPGTEVTLGGIPASGSALVGWQGTCSGTGDCTFVLEEDIAIIGHFNKKTQPNPRPSGNGQCSYSGSNACGACNSDADCGGSNCYTSTSRAPFC